ncbi:MAG: hypothetical protein QM704_21405 [Anaeromyxobacteraceae bacterium]
MQPTPAAQALQAPPPQTWFVPQPVPSGFASPVSAQAPATVPLQVRVPS